jgi:flagellar basal body-associated protein FliL
MSREQAPSNRSVWLAIIVIMATLAAAGAGFTLHLANASPSSTLTGAGAAFVAAMTLGMAASRFLSG